MGLDFILASEPENNSWIVRAANTFDTNSGNIGNLTAHVICIKLVSTEMTNSVISHEAIFDI